MGQQELAATVRNLKGLMAMREGTGTGSGNSDTPRVFIVWIPFS
jgi:hypothetical protein